MLDRLVVSLLLASVTASPALAATPPPGERALFAWADRCPSTAMNAGLYAAGARIEEATSEGRAVLRVHLRDTSVTPATDMTWLLGEGCRAVGIVRADAAPGRARAVGFVVAKEAVAPTAAEQATLLEWAGFVGGGQPGTLVSPVEGKPNAPSPPVTWKSADAGPSGTACPCWEAVAP